MPLSYLAIYVIDMLHILLLMRFCKNGIGSYRVHKRIVGILFAIHFIISCYVRLIPVSRKFSAADTTLFFLEILFLLGAVFLFQGKTVTRLAAALFLPTLYWGMVRIILKTCFDKTFVENGQCIIGTGIAVTVFFILELILEKWEKAKADQEREVLEQEIRMYENQFEIIRQSQENVHSLKHDMKHHLKMLSDLVASEDKNAALAYLCDMGTFMNTTDEFVSSGNDPIDSILNYMIGKAKNAGIRISWQIQIPEQIAISPFDINVILSNLLDNAINALVQTPNPVLTLSMKYDRGLLSINMQNNCRPKQADFQNTHSALETEHGYGLKNVKRIVEKYHGSLSAACVNDVFHASILLFLSDTTVF